MTMMMMMMMRGGGGGEVGLLRIWGDREDRMGAKIKTQKNP